jgi:hypothetical protein
MERSGRKFGLPKGKKLPKKKEAPKRSKSEGAR